MTLFYRLLQRLLPRDLRRQFGEEMLQDTAFLLHRFRYRPWHRRLGLRLVLVGDLLVNAYRHRSRRVRPTTDLPLPGTSLMDTLLQDLRYALRALRGSPSFTAMATLTLALGIGANAAIFSVFNAVLLRPLPYERPEELVVLAQTYNGNPINSSYPDLADWRERARSFAAITGFDDRKVFNLTTDAAPQQVFGAAATANFFEVLGVDPLVGRTFRPEDDRPGASKVVVISERLWRSAFGSDPEIVGTDLRMNGEAYTVIGIVPASFRIPNREQLWVPLATHPYEDDRMTERQAHFLEVIGRLADGASLERGREEIRSISAALAEIHGDALAGKSATAWSLREETVGGVGETLTLLLAAVALVLLIACANVASMTLTRATAQRRELSVRAALGAGRWRLTRQQLAESLVLATGAGVTGLLLAAWGVPLILQLAPDALPRAVTVGVDANVLLFTMVIATVAAVTAGLAPLLATGTDDLLRPLKEGGAANADTSASGGRARRVMIVAEVALAVVLLTGAGLLVRSFQRITAVELGFETAGLLTARVDLPITEYETPAEHARFFSRLRERLASLPGVESVGLSSRLPLTEGTSTSSFYIEGLGDVSPDELPAAHIRFITPGYLEALGIPLLRGERFEPGAPPAGVIVDEQLAESLWPDEAALGKRIRESPQSPWIPVVGVAGRTRHWGQRFGPTQTLYIPLGMLPSPSMMVALRVAEGEPAALAPALRATVADLDPELPLSNVQTMERWLEGSLARPRFNLALLSSFAAVALLLGALGIYGTVGYSVSRRAPEIGVRMALGARATDVLRMVVGQGLRLTLVGLLIGVPAAFGASRLIESMLFAIEPGDPTTLAVAALLVAASAVVASWIPARRATRVVDPVTTLRNG